MREAVCGLHGVRYRAESCLNGPGECFASSIRRWHAEAWSAALSSGGLWPLGTVRQIASYRELAVLTNLESGDLDAEDLKALPIRADAPTSVSGIFV